MTNCKRYKVAAIDLGTVSSRLVLDLPQALPIVTEAEFSSPDENIKIHWAEIQIK